MCNQLPSLKVKAGAYASLVKKTSRRSPFVTREPVLTNDSSAGASTDAKLSGKLHQISTGILETSRSGKDALKTSDTMKLFATADVSKLTKKSSAMDKLLKNMPSKRKNFQEAFEEFVANSSRLVQKR